MAGAADTAFCKLAKNEQDQSKALGSQLASGDTGAIKTLIQKAYAQLPQFVALAPAAIKADVTKLAAIDDKLFAALKANNYDFAKSAPAVTAAIGDPGFTKAGEHVASYLTDSCGVKASFPTAVASP